MNQLLDERDMTVSDFQRRLEAEGVEGSKYSNVRRYVAGEGKSPPALDWIDGAARVLGARPAWLAFGEGEPTDEGERTLREQFTSFRSRFGQPGPDHIVVLVGMGEDAFVSPEFVVLIDASEVPPELRSSYMRRIVGEASEVPPPSSEPSD